MGEKDEPWAATFCTSGKFFLSFLIPFPQNSIDLPPLPPPKKKNLSFFLFSEENLKKKILNIHKVRGENDF